LRARLRTHEVVLDAEIDLAHIVRGHLDMDAVGHYIRPEFFELPGQYATPSAGRTQGDAARARRAVGSGDDEER